MKVEPGSTSITRGRSTVFSAWRATLKLKKKWCFTKRCMVNTAFGCAL